MLASSVEHDHQCQLTAGDLQSTSLTIHWVEFEVHRTGESEGYSDAVEDITVWEDSDIDIVDEDVVEVTSLLVAEERVRHPHLLRVSQR